MFFRFDPQSEKYKSPFGAVACGEKVILSAYALCTEVLSVELSVYSEYDGTRFFVDVPWTSRCKVYDVYSVDDFNLSSAGIYWYCFKIQKCDGTVVYFGNNGLRADVNEVESFQLTVYSKEYETPVWFSQGVTYHIFVDRFNRGECSETLVKDDYYKVHFDRSETPDFLPNSEGEVENRDIYGGNLEGVIEKLSYLNELGIKTIYLSPVFEAWSNHKYNTADYKKIDEHFGDEETLSCLCKKAKAFGMKIILDGVFSHTGSDSLYFNKKQRYGSEIGAWNDADSPYRTWYDIGDDGKYSSWWGIETLPQVNELDSDYRDFIINDDDSVIAHWMRAGISGWRLDVADELPDEFIAELKNRARKEFSEAIVIGEVWEDASTKKAYGVNKKYFTDGVLDGVMNYPLKNAIIGFLCGRISSGDIKKSLMKIVENYPSGSLRCLMNIIGTHDTVRIINELSVGSCCDATKAIRANRVLSPEEYNRGKTMLFLAAVIQYMFPGSPCIYYGDEIGMQGFEDPFNRRFFVWDNIDDDILCFYRKLGKIKTEISDMQSAAFRVPYAKDDVVAFSRGNVIAFVNRGKCNKMFKINEDCELLLERGGCRMKHGKVLLRPHSCCVILERKNAEIKK